MSELRPADPSVCYLPELDPRNQPKRFVRVTFDGLSCICQPCDVEAMTDGCDGAKTEDVWMTEAQWNALPEFGGW